MGIGNFGWMELLIVLLIVAVIFGTAKLRNMGGDLGAAMRNFRAGLKGEETDKKKKDD